MADGFPSSGTLPRGFQIAHLARSDSPLDRVKKLTELTCTVTVLPSLCTLSGDEGLVAVHSAYHA